MRFPAAAEEQLRAMGEFDYTTALLVRPGEQTVSIAVVDMVAGTAGFARQRISAQ